ncbi:hypothetical protein F3Y22_tig00117047pilonHSYRG00069 [Hibiscus syriacus]|uniref:Oberon coiled-coil region domain-containing protein n=1 Tax=Hibiscus syriacus TaxID=106335 RepID=A0A6A2WAT9_HIBSY|nr:hypothetical protein F3Y22_tig00117047pilonHSYRG00069 [Hibiscus syriacus]
MFITRDGVALAGAGVMMQVNRHVNKDSCNSLHRTSSSDNHSLFPSKLVAKPCVDNHSVDSRRRDTENWRVLNSEALREVESYRRMIQAKSDKLEEEYAEKLSKLCLHETEERRRNKIEELNVLEHSHCDYYKLKLRMQAEIAGLLERMQTTKQQWA